MKVYKALLLFISASMFIACGSDDDGVMLPPFAGDSVPGRYSVTALSSADFEVETRQGGTITTLTETVGNTFTDVFLNLETDGTFSLTGMYVEDRTIVITGNPPSNSSSIVTLSETGTYDVNPFGTGLSLTFDSGDVENYNVTLFDGLNLLLNRNEVDGNVTSNAEIRLIKN